MILIDEYKLTNGAIALIGECYGMHYDQGKDYDPDEYDEYIASIVERFWFKESEEEEEEDLE